MAILPEGGSLSADSQPTLWVAWRIAALGLLRTIGRAVVANAALAIALGALGLYAIGVVRTVGILHAEGIPITRGLPVIALQDFLLRGLSLVARPQAFLLSAGLFLLATVVLAIARVRSKRGGRGRRPVELDGPTVAGIACVAVLTVVFVTVGEWLSQLPGLVVGFLCLLKLGDVDSFDQPGHEYRAASLVALLFIAFGASLAMHSYFEPPPLDRVTFERDGGEVRSGRLFYASGDTLYLVGTGDEVSGYRSLVAIPVSALRSYEIGDGPPRLFRTLPEMLGLRFYRFWEDDNAGIHLERSP